MVMGNSGSVQTNSRSARFCILHGTIPLVGACSSSVIALQFWLSATAVMFLLLLLLPRYFALRLVDGFHAHNNTTSVNVLFGNCHFQERLFQKLLGRGRAVRLLRINRLGFVQATAGSSRIMVGIVNHVLPDTMISGGRFAQ